MSTAATPTAHDPNPFLQGKAATALLADLRQSTDGRTGDRLSVAIRAVTKAASTLPPGEVDAAIAAIALLLADYNPSLLNGAPDEPAVREWLREVDTDLTPGRALAANATLARIELDMNNEWQAEHRRAGSLGSALAAVRRLRNGLADAVSI